MALSVSTATTEPDVVSLWPDRGSALFRPAAGSGSAQAKARIRYRNYRYRGGRNETSEPSRSGAKRAFDIIGAGLGLLFLAPLLIAIALIIKMTSRGPVFFTQYATGVAIVYSAFTSSARCTRT